MNTLTFRALALSLLAVSVTLSACSKPIPARSAQSAPTSRTAAQQAITSRRGTPSLFSLSWNAPLAVQDRKMRRARFVLSGKVKKDGLTRLIYQGRFLGLPAVVRLDTQGQALLKIGVYCTVRSNIDTTWRAFNTVLKRKWGPALTLFQPDSRSDGSYRYAAAGRNHPTTGWVYRNGYQSVLSVSQPFAKIGDNSTTLNVEIESPRWVKAYTGQQTTR